jgi:GNAT superfamily N-acetyltransferase
VRFGPDYEEHRRLPDGTPVRLRLVGPADREKLLAGFARLSDESRYTRFFTAMPRLPDATLDRLLHTDGWNHLAIGAEADDGPTETAEGYGIARFIRLDEAPDAAEAAVVVVDSMQRRGLGKLLLSRLAAAARERGITHFRAEILRTNQPMIALLHEIDGAAHPTYEGHVAVYDFAVPAHGDDDTHHGPLFGVLRLAAAGLQVALRRLLPAAPPE